MHKVFSIAISFSFLLLLSWCSYVRPPAWTWVKDQVVSWNPSTWTIDQTWAINSEELVARSAKPIFGNNPTPERAKAILTQLTLLPWFQIEVFAQVPNARSLALAYDEQRNRQVVFVSNKDKSSVYALIDEGSDYTVDTVKEIVKGWKTPNGIAFHNGNLYIAQVSKVHEFTDILNHLDEGWMPSSTIIYDQLPKDTHHGRKYIAFWPDDRLYIPVWAPCNLCDRALPYASIQALDLETKQLETVAKGVRNTVWFAWHPETQQLWFTDNGRDLLGDNIPPDELNVVTKNWEHFGYPFCHGTGIVDPISSRSNCDRSTLAHTNLWPHVAALGMKFYTWSQFPEEFKNKIFIAEHGSRNRSTPIGYRITTVDPKTKKYELFISWRLSAGKTRWRPVDILQLRDWSLLISDDYAGLVYRVVYTGK